ncbi:MATE family efflux transporter [Robinsoniella peoriensis]|uniref:MATE family efflux transporter n=1 Tax=Robinsoniella peoriensis TaxID=180332 RepID=UPI0005C7E5F2|nr:MATE family efflux transporter [Robinsoniella peoriensis]
MKAHQTDFSKGNVYKNILELAVPMTMAQLINLLYNIVDRVYIGRIPEQGTLALTGLGLCFPIITMVSAFANLFGMGGAPLCSIERGRGEIREAEKIMGTSFSMMILCGVLLTILGLIFNRPILYAFGASDATYPFARDYTMIYLCGSVFVMIGLGMNSFINSQGFGQMGMLTVLLGAVTNIILDPIFIFVFGMGVKGAALATIISQFLSAIWVLKFLTGKRAILKLHLKTMKVKWHRLREIVGLGLSGFIMSVTSSAVQVVCNASLQSYGGDLYVGVMTILNSIREILSMPVQGITNGATPVLGFNYGAGNFGQVKKAIRFMSVVCVVITTVSWLILILFPEFFIRIFNNEPEMIQASVEAIQLYFFGFFMMALQFAGQTVFVSLGKAKQAVFFSLLRKAVIVIPLTLMLPQIGSLGVKGVFIAEPVSNFIGGLACFITMLCMVLPELSGKNSALN